MRQRRADPQDRDDRSAVSGQCLDQTAPWTGGVYFRYGSLLLSGNASKVAPLFVCGKPVYARAPINMCSLLPSFDALRPSFSKIPRTAHGSPRCHPQSLPSLSSLPFPCITGEPPLVCAVGVVSSVLSSLWDTTESLPVALTFLKLRAPLWPPRPPFPLPLRPFVPGPQTGLPPPQWSR